ncbi:hypothetical protein POVCU2_0007600 [Plasmodium ovale curtisi]|uniref:PIR Superfamily Protein n=1 Tax=Plasmodium ovale curtisi TaxID=864141 RepID=A0A1A8VK64_PLAOA|nr:hypothetical protein POVCU2_0007600 [Plasmodium ovale curtisi]
MLYYWIYSDGENKKKSAHKARKFSNKPFVGYLEDVHICNNHINKVKKVIPEKVGKLIELYKKFNNISTSATDDDSKCDCANSCGILYKNEVELCYENYYYDFSNELKNFRAHYRRKIKIWNNMNQERYELTPTSQITHSRSQKTPYNIAYNYTRHL